jgi:signal transduction histidine kinase
MRLQQIPASMLHRFRNPVNWVAIAIFGTNFLVWQALHLVPQSFSPFFSFIIPFAFIAIQVALAPIPWLWTGDSRLKTPALRGLLQAIPWNALWLVAIIGILHHLHLYLGAPAGSGHQNTSSPVIPPEVAFFALNFPTALVLGLFLADKERAESSERDMKRLADQTRGQVLQAQLNPHVLFNVLSGLTELVHEDPDAAESAIVGLIQMYRELTAHGVALTAPLEDERRLIEHYLDIEEIRLGERLEVAWHWPTWADRLELPPLLLQPLIENAIKHGISPHPKGGALRISVERKPGRLALSVENNGVPLDPNGKPGTGLGNLRERLLLMPEMDPRLDLIMESEWTVARLSIAWRWNP